MALTERSRLCCLKRKQKRLQRKFDNQNLKFHSALALEPAPEPTLKPVFDPSAKEKAWKKYLYAREIYEETRESEHWRYMQECLTDYENIMILSLGVKAM